MGGDPAARSAGWWIATGRLGSGDRLGRAAARLGTADGAAAGGAAYGVDTTGRDAGVLGAARRDAARFMGSTHGPATGA